MLAHREEILQQAMRTFRRIRHLHRFGPRDFDYLVLDEFHHAAARSYRRLIGYFGLRWLPGKTRRVIETIGNHRVFLNKTRALFDLGNVDREVAFALERLEAGTLDFVEAMGANPPDQAGAMRHGSALSPGGGFLSGARAQEEYLARSSALYACLRGDPMYAFHRARHDPLYTNYVIYSPRVPVFRADSGALLEDPYTVGIITSPAVNATRLPWDRQGEIAEAMRERSVRKRWEPHRLSVPGADPWRLSGGLPARGLRHPGLVG